MTAPTPRDAIAGALFDFLGFLTTRDKPVAFGATEWAAPAVDLLKDWAALRGLPLDAPAIDGWCAALAQPVPDAVPLKWAEAPRRTEWGAGMMEALIALGADETLQLYAHRDAVPLVDALLSAQPAPARVPLTDEQIDAIRGRAECREHVGQRIEFRYRPFTRAIEAAHGIVPAPTTAPTLQQWERHQAEGNPMHTHAAVVPAPTTGEEQP